MHAQLSCGASGLTMACPFLHLGKNILNCFSLGHFLKKTDGAQWVFILPFIQVHNKCRNFFLRNVKRYFLKVVLVRLFFKDIDLDRPKIG